MLCLIALMLQAIMETWCKCKFKKTEATFMDEGKPREKENEETQEVPEIGPQ
jgi:hypothetical protein